MKNLKFLWPVAALRIAGIAALVLVLMFAACENPSGGGGGGSSADKTALNAAITEAETAKAGVQVSADGAGLAVGTMWVTTGTSTAFNSAIDAANGVKNDTSASQAQVDEAVTTLNTAITAFNAAKTVKAQTDLSALTVKI
ncbi:MAG: FIVAR domain-containing protein, partial [Treponema sp.]|nr:FIVAR domain-containing protein [Treponema sp.]